MSEHQKPSSRLKRNIVLIAAILLGVASIILAPLIKTPPSKNPVKEQSVKVRAMSVPSLDVIPRAIGYGRVSSGRTWESVAEISGQVVWVADQLRDGNVVVAGTDLLHIEDANYQLVLAQTAAQLKASEAKMKTARDGLAIAEKNLSLLRADYNRQKKLATNGTISKTVLEGTERQVLTGQSQVENLQNSLDLISAEHQVLIAQHDAAKLDLQRTKIAAPFDVRITRVDIGVAQYANKGQLMFTADGLEVAEVEAQFSVGILRPLIRATTAGNDTDIRGGITRLNAVVRLRTATHSVEWPAQVERVAGTIDPLTQTLGVIVAVDKPYASAIPGERPPLLRDTFVEVELHSNPIAQQIVVPSSAVHKDTVYVINDESRLEIREVMISFSQQGYTVIADGLQAGERIVTSELITAVEGMLLEPQEDKKSKQQMVAEATGKDPGK